MAEPEPEPIHISAEDARGGEIILRKKWQRTVFLIGLICATLLGLLIYAAFWH